MKRVTWISIINGLVLLLLTLAEFMGIWKFDLLLSYQWHKILHIVGVVVFMGNMIVGPVWFSYAYYSRDKALLKFASRLLQITDIYLTIPGVTLAVINGLFLASAFGGARHQPWLFYSMIWLFVMWGMSIPLIFLQEKMYVALDNGTEDDVKTNRLLTYWGILGTAITIPPSVIFYLMVVKSF